MEDYVRTGYALREKFEEIKRGRAKRFMSQEERYKTLLSPLQALGVELGSQTQTLKEMNTKMFSSQDVENAIGDIALEYLLKPAGQVDKFYGVYRDNDGLYIGNKEITVHNNDIYLEDEKTPYKGTRGLWELLTLEFPNSNLYSAEDLNNYEEILLKTDTYRAGNRAGGRSLKKNNGYKYTNIIQPILIKNEIIKTSTKKKKGSGLQKIVSNVPKEYVYWNSIDQLLERLYILYGEIRAGNSNKTLQNEIINIISELKEL